MVKKKYVEKKKELVKIKRVAINMSETFMLTSYTWVGEFVTHFSIMSESSYLQFILVFSF